MKESNSQIKAGTTDDLIVARDFAIEDIPNPLNKYLESYDWFIDRIRKDGENLFKGSDGKELVVSNEGSPVYYKIKTVARPDVNTPQKSAKECFDSKGSLISSYNMAIRIIKGDSRTGKETELLVRDIKLFDIPYMNRDSGTFIVEGNEYALATLEINKMGVTNGMPDGTWSSKFFNPGVQLHNIYSQELKRIRTNIENFLKKNGFSKNSSLEEMANISDKSKLVRDIIAQKHCRYCQNMTNEVGYFKLVDQIVRQTDTEFITSNETIDSMVKVADPDDIVTPPIRHDLIGFVDIVDTCEGAKNSSYYRLCAATVFEKDIEGNYTGYLAAPYYPVQDGKADKSRIVYLNHENVKKEKIALYGEKITDSNNYVQCSPYNLFSVTSSLLSCTMNDDGNRRLMSTIHQNTAVPVLRPEAPLVRTGTEEKVAQWLGKMAISPVDGTVSEIKSDYISIIDSKKNTHMVSLVDNEKRNFKFASSSKSLVSIGDEVKTGQVIADGPCTKDGCFATGVNARVAFMEDQTYEDSFTISKSFAQKLSTVLAFRENVQIKGDLENKREVTNDIENNQDLDENGFVKKGSIVSGASVLVGVKDSRGNDVSAKLSEKDKNSYIVDNVCKTENVRNGNVSEYVVEGHSLHCASFGDKLANRHGNKGTISQIREDSEMPHDENGRPVDIIMSGISMNKRDNIGQLVECVLGKIAEKTGKSIVFPNLEGLSFSDVNRLAFENDVSLYETAYKSDGKPYEQQVVMGNIYVNVLPFLARETFQSRGLGDENSYNRITGQAKQTKDMAGGRTFGNMENWGLDAMEIGSDIKSQNIRQSDKELSRQTYESIIAGMKKPVKKISADIQFLKNNLNALGISTRARIE